MNVCQRDFDILAKKVRHYHEIEKLYSDIFDSHKIYNNPLFNYVLECVNQDLIHFKHNPGVVKLFLVNAYIHSVVNQLNDVYFNFHKSGCNTISFSQFSSQFFFVTSSDFFQMHVRSYLSLLQNYFQSMVIRIFYYEKLGMDSKLLFIKDFENCFEDFSIIFELLSFVLDNDEKNDLKKSIMLRTLIFLLSNGQFKRKLSEPVRSEIVTKIRRYQYFDPSDLMMIISCFDKNEYERMIIFCDLLMENIINDIPFHNRRAKKIDSFQVFIFEKIKFVITNAKQINFPKSHIKDVLFVLYNTITERHYYLLRKCCELYYKTFSVHPLSLVKLFSNREKKEINLYLYKFFMEFTQLPEERALCGKLVK